MSDFVPVTCLATQYLTTHLEPRQWECAVCPKGGYCNGNNASAILPLAGHWFGGFDSSGLPIFVACEIFLACPGVDAISGTWRGALPGINASALSGALPTLAQLVAAASSSSLCQPGYSGVVCQDCSLGFAKQSDGSCSSCPSDNLVLFILGAGLVGIALLCSIIVFFTLRSRGEPSRPEVALLKARMCYTARLGIMRAINTRAASPRADTFYSLTNRISCCGLSA